MIVALDANVLIRDPLCEGIAWRILALGASSWDVRVVVPRVALMEAVAGYQRQITESLNGLDQGARKISRLGLKNLHETMREACADAGQDYAQRLDSILTSLSVEIIDPPSVPLLELVERAVHRRRPCNEKGDGFRDTLNWLAIVDLSRRYPDQEIIWVTDDHDFTSPTGERLHQDLVAELTAAGADDRVRYLPALTDLVNALAAEHPKQPLDEVRQTLRDKALHEYIIHQVIPQALGLPAEPRQCALPIGTPVGRIAGITAPDAPSLTIEVRGGVDGSTVVSFRTVTGVSIMLDVPAGAGDQPSSIIVKDLQVSGLVTVDSFDRPTAGEITEIAALPDDPGGAGWRALDQANSSDLVYRLFNPELLEGTRALHQVLAGFKPSPIASPELVKAFAEQQSALSHLTLPANPTWATVIAQVVAAIALINKGPAGTEHRDDETDGGEAEA